MVGREGQSIGEFRGYYSKWCPSKFIVKIFSHSSWEARKNTLLPRENWPFVVEA